MSLSPSSTTSITATDLAERLAQGAPLTVLDVRDDPAWGIEAPSATSRHLPATAVLADPKAAARTLDGAVAVVCNRGIAAQSVAEALRAEGVDAMLVEGGMRGWIGALQSRPVDLESRRALRPPGPAPRPRLPVLRDRVRQATHSSSTPPPTPSSTARSRPGSARRSPMSSTRTCTRTTSPAPALWPHQTGATPAPAGGGARARRGLRSLAAARRRHDHASVTSPSARSPSPATPPT